MCWLPAKEDGGNPDTLHYNIYEFRNERYEKIGAKRAQGEVSESLCFEFIPASERKATIVIISSATASTDNQESIADTDEVKGRFIALQIISSGMFYNQAHHAHNQECTPYAMYVIV